MNKNTTSTAQSGACVPHGWSFTLHSDGVNDFVGIRFPEPKPGERNLRTNDAVYRSVNSDLFDLLARLAEYQAKEREVASGAQVQPTHEDGGVTKKAHPHADLMLQYAQDAMETDEPWTRWECYADGAWREMTCHPTWRINIQYRRKPKTININGFEVPEPMRVAPKKGEKYFLTEVALSYVRELTWDAFYSEGVWLKLGLVHSTREAAIAHRDALLSFSQES